MTLAGPSIGSTFAGAILAQATGIGDDRVKCCGTVAGNQASDQSAGNYKQTALRFHGMTEEELDQQNLLDEQRKRSLQVIIELANLLHELTIEERTAFLLAVNTLVAGLDAMPAKLGARALFSPETEKLVVVFDEDPDREPVILDLMQV